MNHSPQSARPVSIMRRFLDSEAAGGITLMAAAALALIVANSPFAQTYFDALHLYIGPLSLAHWINDALMAIFFLLVGLEIKREMLDGQLASWPNRMLPGIAAAGGVILPAIIFAVLNHDNPAKLRGWAVPSATDIAFALGVLSLLGSRAPSSLKVFLATLAILDDLAAVVIIAIFYTAEISMPYLGAAFITAAVLFVMNRMDVVKLLPYLISAVILWFFVFNSGVHATVAGVVAALMIPLKPAPGRLDDMTSPLHKLEHALAKPVAFIVVPIFGFANAGISFKGLEASVLGDTLTLGILLGLFLGKQFGVFGAAWLAIKTGLAEKPMGASWVQLYGVAILCGIGFTMSIFIGLLSFPSDLMQTETKIGVLSGSALSAICGYLLLRAARPDQSAANPLWKADESPEAKNFGRFLCVFHFASYIASTYCTERLQAASSLLRRSSLEFALPGLLKRLIPRRFRAVETEIPVVRLHGAIMTGGTSLRPTLSLASTAGILEKAFADKHAPAVAISINSPGGAPVQSRLIYRRIRDLAAEHQKKVFVFVEDVAASGGYMIALAGDEIIADPSSIVGSIGVVSASFGFPELLKKIGVERRVYTAGSNKVTLDPFQPEKAEDIERLKALQLEIHATFIDMVKERRAGKLGDNPDLFSGLFWTGTTAASLGLIDGLGDMLSFLRKTYGDKVKLKLIQPQRGLLGRKLPGIGMDSGSVEPAQIAAHLGDGLLCVAEEKAIWARYGL